MRFVFIYIVATILRWKKDQPVCPVPSMADNGR